MSGILFILVGPSAAGKNTLMKRVQEQLGDLPQLATATTST
jgi:guanylate kinase